VWPGAFRGAEPGQEKKECGCEVVLWRIDMIEVELVLNKGARFCKTISHNHY